jgi:hypothetical protein
MRNYIREETFDDLRSSLAEENGALRRSCDARVEAAEKEQDRIGMEVQRGEEEASALREEGAAADGSASVAPPLPVAAHSAADDEDVVHSAAMGTALRLLERMVTQNSMDELYRDFKYWEDRSDLLAGRDMEGSLLPLWDFSVGQPKLTGAG